MKDSVGKLLTKSLAKKTEKAISKIRNGELSNQLGMGMELGTGDWGLGTGEWGRRTGNGEALKRGISKSTDARVKCEYVRQLLWI